MTMDQNRSADEPRRTNAVSGDGPSVSRRGFIAGAATLAGGALLAGCGGGSSSPAKKVGGGPVELEWFLPGGDSNKQQLAVVKQAIADYHRKNPKVTIKLTTPPWEQQQQALLARVQAKRLPDLLRLQATRVPQFAALGALSPLDAMPGFSELAATFAPGRVASGKFRGNQYAMPDFALYFGLAYHKNMLDKAGVEPPKTLEDFVALSDTFNGGSKGYLQAWPVNRQSLDPQYRVFPFALALGGRALSDDLKTVTYNDAGNVAAMQAFLEIKQRGGFISGAESLTPQEEFSLFNAKKMAFVSGGPWIPLVVPKNKLDGIGALAIPARAAGGPGPAGPAVLADDTIIAVGNNKDKAEAAFDVVRFFKQPKYEIAQLFTGIPTLKASLEEPEAKEMWGSDMYAEIGPKAMTWPGVAQLPQIQDLYAEAFLSAWAGKSAPKPALDQAVQKANKLLSA
jgi:ABC-type glycerol-3-phosphate transport system substrate-binding protein